VQAGKLRHRLVIEAQNAGSPQRSATGASALAWATLVTVWGSLEPLSGRRLEAAQATWPQATVEAKIRYRSEVLDADTAGTPLRISFGSRYYPIGKVLNMAERNIEMRLLCTQGAARG
jgi:SPP1 family predicted phage head-tail adaptor